MVIVCKLREYVLYHTENYLRYIVVTMTPLIWLLLTEVASLYKISSLCTTNSPQRDLWFTTDIGALACLPLCYA